MQIFGTQNLTEQVYTLFHSIQDKDPAIYYWLVEDHHTAYVAQKLFTMFDGSAFVLDPSREDFTLSLSQLQQKQPGIYILTKQTYQDLSKMISVLSDNDIELSVGDKLSPAQLKKQLIDLGYSDHLENTFGFSFKGGVVQVKQGEDTFKVVFDEDGIESIKPSLSSIVPAEIDLEEYPSAIIDLPKGTIVYSDLMSRVPDQKDKIVFQTFEQKTSSRRAPWPTKLEERRRLSVEEMESSARQTEPVGSYYQFGPVKKYRKDFKQLVKDLSEFDGYQIVLSAVDVDVVKTAMDGIDTPVTFVEQTAPAEGFIDGSNKFVLLTHADIFGRKTVKERKRRDEAVFVTKLDVNDFVVHEDHGVARYLGLVETEIEGHKRENLLLEYAKGDKLYVPVELAYKVDRYVGEAKPKLQRLSGTSWIRLSRKASQDSQEFARDLLKLYANRSLVTVDPWMSYPDADQKLHDTFGYHETPDQEQSIEDVYKGLAKPEPMDHLVVGDVGFGKTEVAVRAAYQAVLNHKQVAVLCPTTLLAQQHYDTFKNRLGPLGARVEMLSRFTGIVGDKKGTIKDVVAELSSGEIDIVVGTHRLLSKDVDFRDIGLVIVDEEQKFGVRHKEKLKQIRTKAHILTLSATPIPRTLYFSLSGLRDISTITTPPEGRQPIETMIEPHNHQTIKKAIKNELKRGGQVFYLYNHVQTIQTAKRRLQELLGSKVRIGIVHGQMPEAEMARVTADFDAGKIDVLVCTTIIENGLDMPNVNTLIVDNSTRFGLGQLYQIRGRIGRGSVKAYAYFLYPEEGLSGVAAKRLQILQEAKELGSGFQLAMRDLEMRGMGQLIGKRQHGHIQKVGLGMYGRLLRQAVEELETGEIRHDRAAVNINLPFDYGIPESLISDPEERVRLYRQISQARSVDEVGQLLLPIKNEIDKLLSSDRERVDNLVHILELRFLAEKTPITSIDYQEVEGIDGRTKRQVEIAFKDLGPNIVDALYKAIDDFRVVDQKIIISADEIGDFYQGLKKIIGVLG